MSRTTLSALIGVLMTVPLAFAVELLGIGQLGLLAGVALIVMICISVDPAGFGWRPPSDKQQ